MKRLGLILGGIALLFVAVAVIIPWMTPEKTIRVAVSRAVEALTGRVPAIAGSASLSFLPFPAIRVERISIPGLDGRPSLMQAEALEGTLRLPALFFGRFEMSSVALHRPRLALISDAEGRRSWAFSTGALSEAAAGRAAAGLPLGSIRLIDGTLDYEDARTGRSGSLTLADAALNWSGLGDALSASGIIGWRGQSIDLTLSLAEPLMLLSGHRSEMRGKLASDLFKLNASGTLGGDGRFEGKISAGAASLRALMRWAGIAIGEGDNLADFKLQSPAIIDGRNISFANVEIELDGNGAEGALALKLDGKRPKLSGTLDAETIDLTPYARELDVVEGPARRWREDPIRLDLVSLGDLDLRVSAGKTVFGNARFGRMAAGAMTRDGALELSVGEAEAYGGTVSGRLAFRQAQETQKVTASLDFESVDMAHAFGDLFAFRRLEGTGRGTLAVAATGNSVEELLSSLSGEARLDVDEGTIVGIDLVDVMRRIEKRPLSIGYEPRSGRTSFDKAGIRFAIADGIANAREARLDGQSLSVLLSGKSGLVARSFDLSGEAVLAANADALEPFHLPFKIYGSWDWPVVEPDADALIRRSGAAAPLFQHGTVRAFTAEDAQKPTALPPMLGKTLTP